MKRINIALIVVLLLNGCFFLKHKSTKKRKTKYKIVSTSSDLSLEDGKGIIKGYAYDAFKQTKYVSGAIVIVIDGEKKVVQGSYINDSLGNFMFLLPSGDYTLEFTYIDQGFETKVIKLKSQSVVEINVYFGGILEILYIKRQK